MAAVNFGDIVENCRLARENALLGQYDTALVYYQGVLQQIQKLMIQSKEPSRKQNWQVVSKNSFSIYIYGGHCKFTFLIQFLIFSNPNPAERA